MDNLPELPELYSKATLVDGVSMLPVKLAETLLSAYGKQCADYAVRRAHHQMEDRYAEYYELLRGPLSEVFTQNSCHGVVFCSVYEHESGSIPTTRVVKGNELDSFMGSMIQKVQAFEEKEEEKKKPGVVTVTEQGAVRILSSKQILRGDDGVTVEVSFEDDFEISGWDVDATCSIIKVQSGLSVTTIRFSSYPNMVIKSLVKDPLYDSIRVVLESIETDE